MQSLATRRIEKFWKTLFHMKKIGLIIVLIRLILQVGKEGS